MNLNIENRLFIVTGASDGLGFAVAEALLKEKAEIIAVSRTAKRTIELEKSYPGKIEVLFADVTSPGFPDALVNLIGDRELYGIFVNAGGPPAGTFEQISIEEWDKAYRSLLRWKVELLQKIIPVFRRQKYGRILFSESHSVKQPIHNLILSNSLRAAVTGMAKTLSAETAADNITVNVICPGSHDTHAMQRLYENRMKTENITMAQAKKKFEDSIPLGRLGNPEEFGNFAAWLLSPLSSYLTGQALTSDGGATKGIFG